MYFTAIVPSIELFNLPVFLFITPMFLFSGTFFPVDNLPNWAQSLALVFPLTHLVNITRSLTFGILDRDALWGLFYLIIFLVVFFPLALSGMSKRLIK
jgi:lipooligosaccharide transport system permease protein